MTDDIGAPGGVRLEIDAAGLADGFEAASAEIEGVVRSDLLPAVALIDEAFGRTSKTIGAALSKAAETGKLSFRDMTRSILSDLGKIAVDGLIRRPLEGALSRVFGGLPFGGARAGGGPVGPGAGYLVGERGPEIFTPASAGRVAPAQLGGRAVTVNMNFPAGTTPESFQRSQTQIAAMVARAVSRGERNM